MVREYRLFSNGWDNLPGSKHLLHRKRIHKAHKPTNDAPHPDILKLSPKKNRLYKPSLGNPGTICLAAGTSMAETSPRGFRKFSRSHALVLAWPLNRAFSQHRVARTARPILHQKTLPCVGLLHMILRFFGTMVRGSPMRRCVGEPSSYKCWRAARGAALDFVFQHHKHKTEGKKLQNLWKTTVQHPLPKARNQKQRNRNRKQQQPWLRVPSCCCPGACGSL